MIEARRRRSAIRRAHRASCQAVTVDRFRSIGHRLLDLSHRGAMLELDDDEVTTGETVVVSFDAPRGTGVIDAVAEVRRVEDGFAGLRFTEIEWDHLAKLFVGLGGIPPRIPTRRRTADYAATVRRIARRERPSLRI